MHIPDGFLDTYWVIATYALSLGYFSYIIGKNKLCLDSSSVSLITTMAAAIFVAQMLNWPIPGGTSLHLLGGALAGIILGPYKGSLALALVLIVQAFVFHDGGITTLGANVLNMGIVAVLSGYYIFKLVLKILNDMNNRNVFIASFLAGWLSVFLAGIVCGIEIGLSPQFPYGVKITVPIMGGWHLLLGIVEGLITGLVLVYLMDKSPDMLYAIHEGRQASDC